MTNIKNMKPGALIQLNSMAKKDLLEEEVPRFCLVDNDSGIIKNGFHWKNPRPELAISASKSLLLFVKPLDYSEKTVQYYPGPWASTAGMTVTPSSRTSLSEWRKAADEFQTTGRIPGGVFLTPGGKLIWISQSDLNYFEEATS